MIMWECVKLVVYPQLLKPYPSSDITMASVIRPLPNLTSSQGLKKLFRNEFALLVKGLQSLQGLQ